VKKDVLPPVVSSAGCTGILLVFWLLFFWFLGRVLRPSCWAGVVKVVLDSCFGAQFLVLDVDFSYVFLELVRVGFFGDVFARVFVAFENPLDLVGVGGVGAGSRHVGEGLCRLYYGDVGERQAWEGWGDFAWGVAIEWWWCNLGLVRGSFDGVEGAFDACTDVAAFMATSYMAFNVGHELPGLKPLGIVEAGKQFTLLRISIQYYSPMQIAGITTQKIVNHENEP
jgi:hypothetical protein